MDGIFGGKNPLVNVRDFQWKTFTPMELNMDGTLHETPPGEQQHDAAVLEVIAVLKCSRRVQQLRR